MAHVRANRRTPLEGATALGALAAASGRLFAQQAPPVRTEGPAAPLPQRGELLIRGATVLTMHSGGRPGAPRQGELAAGVMTGRRIARTSPLPSALLPVYRPRKALYAAPGQPGTAVS